MNDWPPDRDDGSDSDRIALDSEARTDLDEALQEAVEAVDAARDSGRARAADASRAEPGGDADDADAAADPEATTIGLETMSTLRIELDELRQRSTRTLADFDNYRKRIEREKRAQERYNGMEVLRGLLDIIDNLERALDSDGPVDDLKIGVEMTLRLAETLLQRHGVRRIDAKDAPFDPSLHEAVSRLEQEGVGEPTVTAVLQSGYQMHDRLLRPVRVAVAVPPIDSSESNGGGDGAADRGRGEEG